MKVFRKLVRDRIPEIIAANGEKTITRVLDDTEFLTALENKLLEEVQEMRASKARLPDLPDRQAGGQAERKVEIADIYEVLDALIRAYGFSKEEIMALKEKKRTERGGFEKRLFLEGTE